MANQLRMAVVDSVHTLLQQGHSQRQIARMLGIHRDTVRRYARLAVAEAHPAGALTGSDAVPPGSPGPSDSKPAGAPPGSAPAQVVQPSRCEPFRELILGKLDQGLSAQRIYQDLVDEHNFAAQYHSVRRFVQKLGQASPLPFRRMECEPGAEAQVDFGTGAPVIIPEDQPLPFGVKSRRRRTHVFRIVLSHSRKAYSEAVCRQTTEDFIRCLENAFWHFGGVPQTLVIDNLKAAVTKADWYDPELNPKIQEFCRHYGTVILPTRPYTPRHKGKIEAGVKYVQSNALKGRTFPSLQQQNDFLLGWEGSTADTRIHGTLCRQVKKSFEEVERPALLPLPPMRFPSFQESRRKVHRDGHIEVAKAYYSVPPEYLGREVWARWDGRLVRIFDAQMQPVTEHVQAEPGRFRTHAQHIAERKISAVERGTAWMLNKVSLVGPQSSRWAEAMLAQRGVQGVRVLQGLMGLTYDHDAEGLEQACATAHSHGAYRLRDVRTLIGRQAPPQERFEFIEEAPIIRSLAEYGEWVHTTWNPETI